MLTDAACIHSEWAGDGWRRGAPDAVLTPAPPPLEQGDAL
jgi:hypothetical protein